MHKNVKVLLIGGTSHVGKSTLALKIAEQLNWRLLSTDQFARHPGRPWRDDSSDIPTDVRDYYQHSTQAELLSSVTGHYQENLWPVAEAIVRSHLNNTYDPCLVLEGSAVLPTCVASLPADRVVAVWLRASDETLAQRILSGSQHTSRSVADQVLIQAFLDRSLAFGHWLVTSASAEHQRVLDVTDTNPYSAVMSSLGLESTY